MKNILYDCEINNRQFMGISVYRAKNRYNRELIADDIYTLSDDDLLLMYMDGGYENFYKEKADFSAGITEMPTQSGHTGKIGNGTNIVEMIEIKGKCSVRLSPFFPISRVMLRGDMEIDCRGAVMRNVSIGCKDSRRYNVRITEVTKGMGIGLSRIHEGNGRIDVSISGAVLDMLCSFTSSTDLYMHIDELDKGLPYEFGSSVTVKNLCISYDSVFDMECLRLSGVFCCSDINLDCKGYKNQLEWLVGNMDMLGGIRIYDNSGTFFSELDSAEYSVISDYDIMADYCTVYIPYNSSYEGIRKYTCLKGYIIYFGSIVEHMLGGTSEHYTVVHIIRGEECI